MSGRFQKEARLKRILNGGEDFKLTKCAQDALCNRLLIVIIYARESRNATGFLVNGPSACYYNFSERKANQYRTEGIDDDYYDPVKELNLVDVEVKYNKFKYPTIPQRSEPISESRKVLDTKTKNEYESISSSKWYKSSQQNLRIV